MKVQFKFRRAIDLTTFEPGRVYELPSAMCGHWYFKALLKDGVAKILDEEVAKPKEEIKEETPPPVVEDKKEEISAKPKRARAKQKS